MEASKKKINRDKYKILHFGSNNQLSKCKMGEMRLGNGFSFKISGSSADYKLSMNQQCDMTAKTKE